MYHCIENKLPLIVIHAHGNVHSDFSKICLFLYLSKLIVGFNYASGFMTEDSTCILVYNSLYLHFHAKRINRFGISLRSELVSMQ